MSETGIVKKIHKWKPFTGRPVGRPKARWEDDVRNDLKKIKLIKWAEHVQDRLKWKGIVEKAKIVPEFYLCLTCVFSVGNVIKSRPTRCNK
jgi:hypothetical protein